MKYLVLTVRLLGSSPPERRPVLPREAQETPDNMCKIIQNLQHLPLLKNGSDESRSIHSFIRRLGGTVNSDFKWWLSYPELHKAPLASVQQCLHLWRRPPAWLGCSNEIFEKEPGVSRCSAKCLTPTLHFLIVWH